jgi:hypothetical protein
MRRVEKEEERLRQEAFVLRDEVVNLTLEKYQLEEADLDLKSPVEKALVLLRGIQSAKSELSNRVFVELGRVIQVCAGVCIGHCPRLIARL